MNNKKNYRGEWVRSSSTPNRTERLKAHEEFMASDLKKMLDDGWDITKIEARPKRHRVKKENFKVVIFCGKPMKITLEEYNNHWVLAFGK